jgi:thiamine kinase-like enzyme
MYDRLKKKYPLSIVHGDLTFENVLISSQSTIVLDWEFAGLEYSFFDWVHFIIFYATEVLFRENSTAQELVASVFNLFIRNTWRRLPVYAETWKLYHALEYDKANYHDFMCLGIFTYFYKKYYYSDIELSSAVDAICHEREQQKEGGVDNLQNG